MTVDELLSTMSETDSTEYGADFLIDTSLRVISVPQDGVILGVEGDRNVNIVHFAMPRYYDGTDLSQMNIRVNYANSGGDVSYAFCGNVTAGADTLTFDWLVDEVATRYKGDTSFAVHIIQTDSQGNVTKAYNTTIATAKVLVGLDVAGRITPQQQADIYTRLLTDLQTQLQPYVTSASNSATSASASKTAAAASAAAALASQQEAKRIVDNIPVIPADYSALSQRVLSTGFVVVGGKLCVTYNT